jgi:GT2 family glycosyltransferase
MRTAAVILNWNGAALTGAAARSVDGQVGALYLVDNGSDPTDRAALEQTARELDARFLPLHHNLGYAGGNNAGISAAMSDGHDAVLILNNDVVVQPGAVQRLVRRLEERPTVAACAPLVVSHETGKVFHSHCDLDLADGSFGWQDYGRAPRDVNDDPRPTGYVSGEAILMRADAIRECGAFDERFFLTFEDTEWSARVRRAGWVLETCPAAVVVHHHSATMGDSTSAFYLSRNYPLFLHVAIHVPLPIAFARGTRFAGGMLVARLRRRNWHGVRGVLRGWAASGAALMRAAGGILYTLG